MSDPRRGDVSKTEMTGYVTVVFKGTKSIVQRVYKNEDGSFDVVKDDFPMRDVQELSLKEFKVLLGKVK